MLVIKSKMTSIPKLKDLFISTKMQICLETINTKLISLESRPNEELPIEFHLKFLELFSEVLSWQKRNIEI